MMRLLLTVLVIVFFVLCVAAMWWGWRNRQRRQSHLPALPAPPESFIGEPLLPPARGVYVSTTTVDNWQDRIAVARLGFRSEATLFLYAGGLLVERTGADPLWIPAGALLGARTGRAMAGKVMGIEGLLVITWKLGDYRLDTGFRGDDKDSYGEWIDAVRALVTNGTATAGAASTDGLGGDER